MIDVGNIVLRRKGEQGLNVSKNSLPEHKGIVAAITTDEELEMDLSQLFVGATCEGKPLEDLEFPTIP